ncbi:MAG TPA: HEXXH motif-containing putative peptide modification protein, partial [Acetobacteraceae bacterium]
NHVARFQEAISGAMDMIEHIAPETAETCLDSMHIFAVFTCSGSRIKGGTSSTSVGLSFFCMEEIWTIHNIALSYIHECVHNALFIEDMINGLFAKQKYLEGDAQVISAVRQVPRNYDLAFHAGCVALELANFKKKVGTGRLDSNLVQRAKFAFAALEQTLVEQKSIGRSPLTPNGESVLAGLAQEARML